MNPCGPGAFPFFKCVMISNTSSTVILLIYGYTAVYFNVPKFVLGAGGCLASKLIIFYSSEHVTCITPSALFYKNSIHLPIALRKKYPLTFRAT